MCVFNVVFNVCVCVCLCVCVYTYLFYTCVSGVCV